MSFNPPLRAGKGITMFQNKSVASPQISSLALLQAAFPGVINLTTKNVGVVCSFTPGSIRTLVSRGTFEIKSTSSGRRRIFDIRDVAEYLDKRRAPKPRRGPKSKVEKAKSEGDAV